MHTLFLCEWENFLYFPRSRLYKRRKLNFFLSSAPFRPFLFKIGQNSAAGLSVRSTFYLALFDLCGRTIGQLTKLAMDSGGGG